MIYPLLCLSFLKNLKNKRKDKREKKEKTAKICFGKIYENIIAYPLIQITLDFYLGMEKERDCFLLCLLGSLKEV
jgi:hypothetical protein